MRTGADARADSGEALLRRMAVRRRRDNILVAVLAVLAVLGGGHALFSFFSPEEEPPGDDAAVAVAGHAQMAESFAQEFVVTYLGASSGDQEILARFVGSNQQISLPKTGQQVADPIVVYSARAANAGGMEVWSVTVSARVGKSADAPRQYFRVPVSVSAGTLRALGLPAAVEPPGKGQELAQVYSSPCSADKPVAHVAEGFLAAFLTGSGDVARYISLDAGIGALAPPPYSGLANVSVSADNAGCGDSGETAQVLATVEPESSKGTAPTLTYPLTMVRTEGQWQVRSIDPIPALKQPLTVVTGQQEPQAPAQPAAPDSGKTPESGAEIPPAQQN